MLSSKGQRFQGNRAEDPIPVADSMKPWPCFTSKCRKTHGITSWMVYWLKFSRLHMKHWVVSSIYCLLNLIWPQDNGLNGWIHGPVRPKTSCGNAWRSSVAIFPFPLLEVSCQTLQSGTSRSINKLVIGVVFFVGVFARLLWRHPAFVAWGMLSAIQPSKNRGTFCWSVIHHPMWLDEVSRYFSGVDILLMELMKLPMFMFPWAGFVFYWMLQYC